MPLILPREMEKNWLQTTEDKLDEKLIKELVMPFETSKLEAYPVAKLKGKDGVGNSFLAVEKHHYPELESEQGSLF